MQQDIRGKTLIKHCFDEVRMAKSVIESIHFCHTCKIFTGIDFLLIISASWSSIKCGMFSEKIFVIFNM